MPQPRASSKNFSAFLSAPSERPRLAGLLCQLKHRQGRDVDLSLIEATGCSQSHISRQLGQLYSVPA